MTKAGIIYLSFTAEKEHSHEAFITEDQNDFEAMNQFYTSMGYQGFASFEQYIGKSESQYDKGLGELVQDQAKEAMIYQAIYEAEGLSVSLDDYDKYLKDTVSIEYEDYVEEFGKGYTMQQLIGKKVLEYLKETAVIQ